MMPRAANARLPYPDECRDSLLRALPVHTHSVYRGFVEHMPVQMNGRVIHGRYSSPAPSVSMRLD